ncbi:hypothetical protein M6B38_359670 [Iris pallida]|uniref:Uncharacterized protein n=1 Tax=Iris pallida TaxID=29817 RepID=A0AAX6GJZ0_IRIPA|nr:hypothetical protein M6B38_359670 [Iris pallida]
MAFGISGSKSDYKFPSYVVFPQVLVGWGLIWFPLGFLQTTCTNGRTHPHSNQMAR